MPRNLHDRRENTTSPQGGEEVKAGDAGSGGDQTTNVDNNVVYSQTALYLVCGVLLNTLNTVG